MADEIIQTTPVTATGAETKPAETTVETTPVTEKPLLSQDGKLEVVEPKPVIDKDGKPVLDKDGKPTFEKPAEVKLPVQGKPIVDKDGKPVLDKDGKPTFEAALHGAPPEKYEAFVLPEGFTIDPKDSETFSTLAKDANLTQAGAQKFMDLATQHTERLVKAAAEKQTSDWVTVRKSWTAAIKSDPEIGGANFEQSREYALRAVKTLGTTELVQQVFESGWGDNPHLFKFCVKAGRALGEDRSVDGRQPIGQPKPAEKVLYPSQA